MKNGPSRTLLIQMAPLSTPIRKGKTKMKLNKAIVIVLLILSYTLPAIAVEIKGKVVDAEGSRAKIAYDSNFAPREGDKAQIGFELGKDFIPVPGEWEIIKVTFDFLWAESKSDDSGTPSLDYLVIIQSDNPQKRADLSTSLRKQTDNIKQSEEQQQVYLPSLNAKVVGLKFFEGGYGNIKLGQRDYKKRFPAESSKVIQWELNLEFPKPGKKICFDIVAIYYRHDGSEFGRQTKRKSCIKENWTNSVHSWGKGWSQPGNWKPGTYKVDLYIENQLIASGSFKIDP